MGTTWLAKYETDLRQRRLNEKLQSLIMATVRVSEGEVRQRFIEQNQKIDAQYALFDAAAIGDNDVPVTDADLKAYYDENIDQFKFDATRMLKYACTCRTNPRLRIRRCVKRILRKLRRRPKAGRIFCSWFPCTRTSPIAERSSGTENCLPRSRPRCSRAKPGDIVGPILDNGTYRLMKVLVSGSPPTSTSMQATYCSLSRGRPIPWR